MKYSDLLHVFTVTWNEDKILPDFIKWYRDRIPNCLITIYDNQSTDKTVQIGLDNNCEIISFNTRETMDELTLTSIRNVCWLKSKANYICIVDADEWVDLKRSILISNEKKREWNICKCLGYEIFGKEGDNQEDLLYGCYSNGYSKPVLFKRQEIQSLNLVPGSHGAIPHASKGFKIKIKEDFPNLYHTKFRSWSHAWERTQLLKNRKSENSRRLKHNLHYDLPESVLKEYYLDGLKNRIKIR